MDRNFKLTLGVPIKVFEGEDFEDRLRVAKKCYKYDELGPKNNRVIYYKKRAEKELNELKVSLRSHLEIYEKLLDSALEAVEDSSADYHTKIAAYQTYADSLKPTTQSNELMAIFTVGWALRCKL